MGRSRVVYKSRQPVKFAGFSARFRRLLSMLRESKHSLNMSRRWTHNRLLFTKLRLLKNLKKTLVGGRGMKVRGKKAISCSFLHLPEKPSPCFFFFNYTPKKGKSLIKINQYNYNCTSSIYSRVVQYTRTESGRLFGKDDSSSGSRVVVFAEEKKQEIVF